MTEESSLYRGAIERVRNTVVTFGGDLLEFVDIDPEKIEEEVFAVLDHRTAAKFKVVPVSFDGVEAVIALSDPSNIVLADDLRMALAPLAVRFVAADPDLIESALRRWSRLRALIEEREAVAELRRRGLVAPGERLILTRGDLLGVGGSTTTLKILQA